MEHLFSGIFCTMLPLLLLAGLLSILAGVFKSRILPGWKGKLGEAQVNLVVRLGLDSAVYHLVPDVTLPTPDGTTQIDHVIVSRYGVFVVESKNYKGWIFGSENDAQWTQQIYGHRSRFQNPLRQNYKHTKTLAQLTGLPESYFISVVVFVDDCAFKTAMPANVAQFRTLIGFIKSHQTPIIQDRQVSEVVRAIREWAGTVSPERKDKHVQNLRRSKEPVRADAAAPVCPNCGCIMVLRSIRRGGSQFWGCSEYPKCKGLRQCGED